MIAGACPIYARFCAEGLSAVGAARAVPSNLHALLQAPPPPPPSHPFRCPAGTFPRLPLAPSAASAVGASSPPSTASPSPSPSPSSSSH